MRAVDKNIKKEQKKQKFLCGSCGYKFSRFSRPNMCPYCGKAAVEVDTTRGAEDLLAEIEEMEEDMKQRGKGM